MRELKMRESEFEEVFDLVMDELKRAEIKFPEWPDDVIHAAAIVGEESGELMRASLQYSYENAPLANVEAEAVQTVAMCFRLLVGLKRGWYK